MSATTTTIGTQGHFGAAMDRLVAIATQGHFLTFHGGPHFQVNMAVDNRQVEVKVDNRQAALGIDNREVILIG